MKKEEFYEILGNIEPKYIAEAEIKNPRKSSAKKALIAACICLTAIALSIAAMMIMQGQNIISSDKDKAPILDPIEYNDAYYGYFTSPELLKKFGLSTELNSKLAGRHVAYIRRVDGELKESVSPTDMELYEYAPYPCDGVMILRDGKEYEAAVFCNHLNYGGGIQTAMEQIYGIYGIRSADDIRSISQYDEPPRGKGITRTVNDRSEIEKFYSASLAMKAYNNDDFDKMQFRGDDESQKQQMYIAFADDYKQLRIETSGGVAFFMKAYANFGWLEGDLTHYKFNDDMTAWFNTNFK